MFQNFIACENPATKYNVDLEPSCFGSSGSHYFTSAAGAASQ